MCQDGGCVSKHFSPVINTGGYGAICVLNCGQDLIWKWPSAGKAGQPLPALMFFIGPWLKTAGWPGAGKATLCLCCLQFIAMAKWPNGPPAGLPFIFTFFFGFAILQRVCYNNSMDESTSWFAWHSHWFSSTCPLWLLCFSVSKSQLVSKFGKGFLSFQINLRSGIKWLGTNLWTKAQDSTEHGYPYCQVVLLLIKT